MNVVHDDEYNKPPTSRTIVFIFSFRYANHVLGRYEISANAMNLKRHSK